MTDPIQVEVIRGRVVEAVHTVHAVAVRDGQIVAEAGDPRLSTFLRSSAKPIQALPLVRARPDLADREIAIACASHLARPDQLDAVRTLLAQAPATEADLETGADLDTGSQSSRIEHNCSGKHAGFLAVCRVRGFETRGYRSAAHPLQEEVLAEVAAAAEVDPLGVPVAIDGCGVPTFALPLDRCAHAFARLPVLEGGRRVIAAMRAHPEMLRGPVAADAMLVRELDSWAAKGGAEGLFCACSLDGLGVALKVEDGAFRGIRPALAAFLGRLGFATGELGFVTVENSHGETVGELRTRPASHVPKGRSRV
jgi:L-asparaginase II